MQGVTMTQPGMSVTLNERAGWYIAKFGFMRLLPAVLATVRLELTIHIFS